MGTHNSIIPRLEENADKSLSTFHHQQLSRLLGHATPLCPVHYVPRRALFYSSGKLQEPGNSGSALIGHFYLAAAENRQGPRATLRVPQRRTPKLGPIGATTMTWRRSLPKATTKSRPSRIVTHLSLSEGDPPTSSPKFVNLPPSGLSSHGIARDDFCPGQQINSGITVPQHSPLVARLPACEHADFGPTKTPSPCPRTPASSPHPKSLDYLN